MKYWSAHFLTLEMVLAVVCSLLFVVWSETINNGVFVSQFFGDGRQELYNALATIFGSMLGFSITAVSIVLGYAQNEKLEILRISKHYSVLWDVFKSTIKVLAASTVMALVGLIGDKDANPSNVILYLNLFLSMLCAFRISRTIWVLEYIIAIVATKKRT
ncbi:MAG: hypothetical protein HY869_19575 [Chloroflexi bacterium]|nr:hypothetical protein [Chloroflexota bacterium]